MTAFVWIDRAARSPAQQMAVDLAMVEVARRESTRILRLYQWQSDTISFGANEAVMRTWNRALIESEAIACVRRPTGGRAVWHAATDLTYSWAGPSGGPGGARRTYRSLHERLGRAVASLGVTTSLAPAPSEPSDLRPGACFEGAVGGELLAGGRKLLGSAQQVMGDHLLQHGAFSRRDQMVALSRFRSPPAAAARSSQQIRIPGAEALADAIAARWLADDAEWIVEGVATAVCEASVPLESRFSDPAWTWRR